MGSNKDTVPGTASQPKKIDPAIVAKAGLWYTICNFTFKGLAFITTPIFARLLTKSELGYFGNYASWVSILLILTSFDFAQSIIRSKLDFQEDLDAYIWSILSLSTLWTLLVYGVVCLFSGFFTNLLQVEMKHIHIMFLYFLTVPAYTMLITKHRAKYKYKTFALITGIATVTALIASLTLVFIMEDRVSGRIIGHYMPYIILGLGIYILIVRKGGGRPQVRYWKYAIVLCLPLVPHILSMNLLSQSDKIIITRLCGREYTAIYTIAYSCYHIATILLDSLNKAWAPWLLDSLHLENYEDIRTVSKKYVLIVAAVDIMVLLAAPEVILLLGGRQYHDAIYCMPPLLVSCVIQLIYTMYVNIEFFKKKTFGVSLATMAATAFNIILNFIFIPMNPERGYVIASYTTLAGYILLFALHFLLVKRLGMGFVFDIRFLMIVIAGAVGAACLVNLLYSLPVVRYAVMAAYIVLIGWFAVRHKDEILSIVIRKKRR